MPIVLAADSLILEDSAVSLARYAQLIGYSECSFFGVNADVTAYACRTIWTLDQRRTVAKYLAEAQGEIEDILRYPLSPKWFTDEEHQLRCPTSTKWGKVLAAGIRAETMIEAGATVDLRGVGDVILDPATISVATAVVADEIHIYHPDSEAEIFPSAISISGGVATISIPRCRLVANQDNPPEGWEYDDDDNFLDEVDVKRVYNDPSVNATLVSYGGFCSCGTCTETTTTGCMSIVNKEIGAIIIRPATYVDSAWSVRSTLCARYGWVRLNYRAGLESLTYQMEDAIIRLAHSKMPSEPCGCDIAQGLWKRDRAIPEAMTEKRANNPFGLNDGAWVAYRRAMSKKLVRAGVL